MRRVAILGANGFIGSRIVEQFFLQRTAEVLPVVRDASAFARAARFNLKTQIADAFDERALATAFKGCDAVVHAIAGDTKTIVGTVAPVYKAAQHAGVRRLIYLSSASVHGQSPEPGTDESSALSERQPIPYNVAKVRAERMLRKLRDTGSVEVVLLRPAIVWGPRSSWIGGFANDLLAGNAFLVEGAKGICNSIYIDNLVHAVELALTATGADRRPFLLTDNEQVTWAELLRPVAEALGYDFMQIPSAAFDPSSRLSLDRVSGPLKELRHSLVGQTLKRVTPLRARRALAAGVRAFIQIQTDQSPWDRPTPDAFKPTLEQALLQRCCYKLPATQAKEVLGFASPVSFREGCRRSIEWLAFAGYPVLREFRSS
jgi:nucleoside-diphosphate-sugar epimerase